MPTSARRDRPSRTASPRSRPGPADRRPDCWGRCEPQDALSAYLYHLDDPGNCRNRLIRARHFPHVMPRPSADKAMQQDSSNTWHGTTIIAVRKGGRVALAGDGQVSMGNTVVKSNARKLRRLANGTVLAGFAGATADAFALFERLEAKLEQYPGQLTRACVELAKDWRTDRYLRRLEAIMAVADKSVSLIVSGTGDVLEPEDGLIGIGSGGPYALAAARALIDVEGLDAEAIAKKAMAVAASICAFTNDKVTIETL